MKKQLLITSLLILGIVCQINAQQGFGTVTPDASAIIDAVASNKGILIPRVALTGTSDVTTIATPATSLMVYNTATASDVTPGFYYYDGSIWQSFATAAIVEWADDTNIQGGLIYAKQAYTAGNRVVIQDNGRVGMGYNTPTAALEIKPVVGTLTDTAIKTTIDEANSSRHYAVSNTLSGTGTGYQYGVQNTITNTGGGFHYGVKNELSGTGTGQQHGIENTITNLGNGVHYGVRNNLSGAGTGTHYGLYTNLSGGTVTGLQYGVHSIISSTGSSTHYGARNTLSGGTGVQYGVLNTISAPGNSGHYGVRNEMSGLGSGTHWGTYNAMSGTGTSFQYGSYNYFTNTSDGVHTGVRNDFVNNGNGIHYGVYNTIGGAGSGSHYGIRNTLSGAGIGGQFGTSNAISNSGNSVHYGTYSLLSGLGTGIHYGVYTQLSGAGTGIQYGARNIISNSGNGGHYGVRNDMSGSGTAGHVGVYNFMSGVGTGTQNGSYNYFTNSSDAVHAGVKNNNVSAGNGNHYGIDNTIGGTGTGTQYGVDNKMTNSGSGVHAGSRSYLSGTGAGDKYGSLNRISALAGGKHYAVYGEALKAGADVWAGYFRGKVAVTDLTGADLATDVIVTANASTGELKEGGTLASITTASEPWLEAVGVGADQGSTDIFYTNGDVGIGTTTPDASAITELSSTTKGFLPPRMTTVNMNAIASPAEGLIVYNTDKKCLSIYTDGWNCLLSDKVNIPVVVAHYKMNTDQTLPTSGSTPSKINFNNLTLLDTDFITYDTASDRFTILEAGTYQITVQVGFLLSSGDNIIGVLDASSQWIGRGTFTSGENLRDFSVYTTVLNFNIGDVFSGGVYNLFNTVQGIQSGATGSGDLTSITVMKL